MGSLWRLVHVASRFHVISLRIVIGTGSASTPCRFDS
jgi:hypothetical protein